VSPPPKGHDDARQEPGGEVVFERFERPVRGADHPQVGPARARVAQALVLAARIQHPQQVGLHRGRQLADLVEEQGRTVCFSHEPRTFGAPAVGVVARRTEQLGVDQALGEGGGVARHQLPCAAPRHGVQRRRRDLFAHAARALQEHMVVVGGGKAQLRPQTPRRGALTDHAVGVGRAEGKRIVGTSVRRRRLALHHHQHQGVAQGDGVAFVHLAALALFAVDQELVFTQVLHHQGVVSRGREAELGAGDARALERRGRRRLAGAPTAKAGVGRGRFRCAPPEGERPFDARGLAQPLRLVERPRDDQLQASGLVAASRCPGEFIGIEGCVGGHAPG
jgi:hypothetical protein